MSRKKWGVKSIDRLKMLLATLFTAVYLAGVPPLTSAQDAVFILDKSQSMTESDPTMIAPEGVKAMLSSLGEGDRAAFLTFSTEVSPMIPLTGAEQLCPPKLPPISYDGYTNTGAALQEAVNLLKKNEADRRSIVLITDGEIMLPDAEGTLESAQNFAAAMERAAKENIRVYILSWGTGGLDEYYRLHSAYAKIETVTSDDFVLKARRLVREELNTPALDLPLTIKRDAADRITGFTANLPVTAAKVPKAIVYASKQGQAAPMGKLPGEASAVQVADLGNSPSPSPEFTADYPPGTELKVDVSPEMEGRLLLSDDGAWLKSPTNLMITPVSNGEDPLPLLKSGYFDGKDVRLKVNGEEAMGRIKDGVITVPLPQGIGNIGQEITVEDIDFRQLGIKFTGENSAKLVDDKGGNLPWILAALAIAVLGGLFWLTGRKKSSPHTPKVAKTSPAPLPKAAPPPSSAPVAQAPPSPPPPPPLEKETTPPSTNVRGNTLSYQGRLVLYITKTADGSDVEPLEYNLFRQSRGREIDLATVLKDCGAAIKLPDTKDIVFGPLDHGIYLFNKSNATITKRGDILLKNTRKELYYDERVHIAFSDEVSEMIVIYKSFKPQT